MPASRLTIDEINALDRASFVAALGPVFEGPPWIVERAWEERPFADLMRLHERLRAVMDAAPVELQVELIRAHPDLVGRAALAGALTPESTGEQASAGLDRLSPAEVAAFTELNAAYHERFGFPFVICVRENKKEGILAGFNARLGHTREGEITTALSEVAKIAWLRLLDRVQWDNGGRD
ncbi:MAG: 2-oxo-4-hydroxy-4-carboxy-5-ureidoimidazoline decarboxylase [Chloroflexi bacterium]|nr:2-oxo-4-hydroxy-4-carboxy-5-ureidoimidazoline decarboxylase [Chloroflexota bacterium]